MDVEDMAASVGICQRLDADVARCLIEWLNLVFPTMWTVPSFADADCDAPPAADPGVDPTSLVQLKRVGISYSDRSDLLRTRHRVALRLNPLLFKCEQIEREFEWRQ
jgi:hypothetical protein